MEPDLGLKRRVGRAGDAAVSGRPGSQETSTPDEDVQVLDVRDDEHAGLAVDWQGERPDEGEMQGDGQPGGLLDGGGRKRDVALDETRRDRPGDGHVRPERSLAR